MAETRKIHRLSVESDAAIREYSEAKGLDMGAAADALIATAVSRLNALKRYAVNKKEPRVRRAKSEARVAQLKAAARKGVKNRKPRPGAPVAAKRKR